MQRGVKNAEVQVAEPLQTIILFRKTVVCHRYTVGTSADISAASVSLTKSPSVPLVYQIAAANGEETLNEEIRNYYQKAFLLR